jgi:hypothetical protein
MVPPVGKHPYSLIRDDLRIPPVVLFVARGYPYSDRRARLYLKSVTGRTRAPTRGTRPSVHRKAECASGAEPRAQSHCSSTRRSPSSALTPGRAAAAAIAETSASRGNPCSSSVVVRGPEGSRSPAPVIEIPLPLRLRFHSHRDPILFASSGDVRHGELRQGCAR